MLKFCFSVLKIENDVKLLLIGIKIPFVVSRLCVNYFRIFRQHLICFNQLLLSRKSCKIGVFRGASLNVHHL
jgi:hypothetical protein